MEHKQFSIIDYLVFGTTFAISASVGVYHAWKSRNIGRNESTDENDSKKKTEEFLIGGRKLPVIPVSLSLMTTFVSGFSLLGVPAEIYQRAFISPIKEISAFYFAIPSSEATPGPIFLPHNWGSFKWDTITGVLMWVYQMMGAPVLLTCAYLFLPIFYKMRPISIYQYFEVRYDSKLLRKLASTLFLLNTAFYMAVVMYAPAVALSGVTNVSTWPLILSVGLVCTFYTSLGGLKSVVWADTIQAGFMYAGVLALIIKGAIDSGGFREVWQIASEGARFQPLTFINPNPVQYFSLWIAILGGLSFWFSLYGLNQMAVQRYCSLSSLRQARAVIAITAPAYVLLLSVCSFIGLVMVAYFWNCDPLGAGEIKTKDQLVILFVTRTLKSIPGLPGLFLACLFSGTLSTVSSGINSMAAVTWEDFLKDMKLTQNISDARATIVNKFLVCIFGLISLALSFAAEPMGGIIQSAISMMGSLAGPLVGLFFLGVLVPWTNKHGALIGCFVSMVICIWMTMGSIIYKPYAGYQLFSNNSQCPQNNTSNFRSDFDYDPHYGKPNVFVLYRVSSFLFSFIGIMLVVVIAPLVSLIFKPKTRESMLAQKKTSAYTIFGYHRGENDPNFTEKWENTSEERNRMLTTKC